MRKFRLFVIGNGMAVLRFLDEVVALSTNHFDITAIGEEPEPACGLVSTQSHPRLWRPLATCI
jgi:NAD(P)H-nitrite reductase large subunit